MLAACVSDEDVVVPHSTRDEERELLRAVANKDKTAYETLYCQYHSRVYLFVIRMVNTHDLAEEVAADSLYAVWTHADRYQGKSSVSTWLLGIAYRKALKAIEKESRHRRFHGDDDVLLNLEETDPARNPEIHTSDKLIDQQVQQAMLQLSVNHRSVITLTAMGHSSQEIAESQECSANTVKTRVYHARRQLWTLLEAAGINTQSREFSS